MKQLLFYSLFLSSAFIACNDDGLERPDDGRVEEPSQTFTFRIESVGEAQDIYFTRAGETAESRPVFSMSPKQTIDRVDILIVDEENAGMVVCKKTITGWSNTDTQTSRAYIDGKTFGREADIVLTGNEMLEEGKTYIAYGVGYHTGSYGNYTAFADASVGSPLGKAEIATIPSRSYAQEIFAGAELLHVEDGKLLTRPTSNAQLEDAIVTARRQVAGTYGYFTRVQAVVNGKAVHTLRLVTTLRNRSLIFGGFRSLEDPENFNITRVVNGTGVRTDFDARLAGSEHPDAFTVYDVNLAAWFPGEGDEPADTNGDGYLDAGDTNWQIDPSLHAEGAVKLAKGTVFGNSYLVPAAVGEAEIEAGQPTFQLQLLDREGNILRHLTPIVRDEEELSATRTIVSLDDRGRAIVTTGDNPETALTYSIYRNNIYTLGDKNSDQIYGEDEPLDLSAGSVLVMDVNPEWEALEAIIFN